MQYINHLMNKTYHRTPIFEGAQHAVDPPSTRVRVGKAKQHQHDVEFEKSRRANAQNVSGLRATGAGADTI